MAVKVSITAPCRVTDREQQGCLAGELSGKVGRLQGARRARTRREDHRERGWRRCWHWTLGALPEDRGWGWAMGHVHFLREIHRG